MKNVLITGGTGLVGNQLSKTLITKGYSVGILSRERKTVNGCTSFIWNVNNNEIEAGAIEWADYIIHLAGENIGDGRWTKKRKQLIIDSRVKSGQLLYEKIKQNKKQLQAFISSSAIGYYGAFTCDKIFEETDAPATDFLGNTCLQWEQVADKFDELGIRTVKIRTGIVLSKYEGALEKIAKPIKMGMGSALGSGNQYMPWIHIDDLCGIYIKAIEDSRTSGAYNAVAPEHIRNKEFTTALAAVLHKPLWLPNIPTVFIKVLFGEMAAMVLTGSRVSSKKIRDTGYNFLYPSTHEALIDLLYTAKTG